MRAFVLLFLCSVAIVATPLTPIGLTIEYTRYDVQTGMPNPVNVGFFSSGDYPGSGIYFQLDNYALNGIMAIEGRLSASWKVNRSGTIEYAFFLANYWCDFCLDEFWAGGGAQSTAVISIDSRPVLEILEPTVSAHTIPIHVLKSQILSVDLEFSAFQENRCEEQHEYLRQYEPDLILMPCTAIATNESSVVTAIDVFVPDNSGSAVPEPATTVGILSGGVLLYAHRRLLRKRGSTVL